MEAEVSGDSVDLTTLLHSLNRFPSFLFIISVMADKRLDSPKVTAISVTD
jgi:hypothetical protein